VPPVNTASLNLRGKRKWLFTTSPAIQNNHGSTAR
jgi:hypothetical protein